MWALLLAESGLLLQNMNMPELFLDALARSPISKAQAEASVVLQCFSYTGLQSFSAVQKRRGYDLPLVWLVGCEDGLPSTAQLRALSRLATHVGIGCAPFFVLTSGCLMCNMQALCAAA